MRYHLIFFSNPQPNKNLWSRGSNKCGIHLAQKPNSENKQIERKNTWRNKRFFKNANCGTYPTAWEEAWGSTRFKDRGAALLLLLLVLTPPTILLDNQTAEEEESSTVDEQQCFHERRQFVGGACCCWEEVVRSLENQGDDADAHSKPWAEEGDTKNLAMIYWPAAPSLPFFSSYYKSFFATFFPFLHWENAKNWLLLPLCCRL